MAQPSRFSNREQVVDTMIDLTRLSSTGRLTTVQSPLRASK